MIKAIFWDNDGVLVDTERLYFLATQQVLATVDVHLTKEQYRKFYLAQGTGNYGEFYNFTGVRSNMNSEGSF